MLTPIKRWALRTALPLESAVTSTFQSAMSKAFTKETDVDDDDIESSGTPIPAGAKNYITPGGYRKLKGSGLFVLPRAD